MGGKKEEMGGKKDGSEERFLDKNVTGEMDSWMIQRIFGQIERWFEWTTRWGSGRKGKRERGKE